MGERVQVWHSIILLGEVIKTSFASLGLGASLCSCSLLSLVTGLSSLSLWTPVSGEIRMDIIKQLVALGVAQTNTRVSASWNPFVFERCTDGEDLVPHR